VRPKPVPGRRDGKVKGSSAFPGTQSARRGENFEETVGKRDTGIKNPPKPECLPDPAGMASRDIKESLWGSTVKSVANVRSASSYSPVFLTSDGTARRSAA